MLTMAVSIAVVVNSKVILLKGSGEVNKTSSKEIVGEGRGLSETITGGSGVLTVSVTMKEA